MSKTLENLQAAFAGESQANRKYLAFADKAEAEGLKGAAQLFRAAAAAETVHAHNHLRAMKGVRSTKENLEEAFAGETHEFKNMYPDMIATAKAEGDGPADRSFTFANEVEKVHADLYHAAMADPASLAAEGYYVCRICGYTHAKDAPEKCPVCGATQKAFFKVE